MMPARYLAMVARGQPSGTRMRALGRTASRVLPGATAAVTPVSVLVAQGQSDHGVWGSAKLQVLGEIYASSSSESASASTLVKAACRTAGRTLVERCWGGYVAFVIDPGAGEVHVVRDPSGALPCYFVERPGFLALSSHMELLVAAGLLEVEIAWDQVRRHALAPQLRVASTCVEGLTEVLPGHRLTIRESGWRLDAVWSPWTFARRDRRILDMGEASERLRSTVLESVDCTTSNLAHPLVSVSGGLDSSIVASSLGTLGRSFTCLTVATMDAGGDERPFARAMCRHLGCQLIEGSEDPARVDFSRSDASHLPRPIARAFAQSGDRLAADVARAVGADGFVHGGGGDNVFCHLRSSAPIADRLLVDGFLGGWDTAKAMGSLTGVGAIRALAKGLRRATVRGSASRWPVERDFLRKNSATRAIEGGLGHAWLAEPDDALPGSAGHIANILSIQNHLEGFGREQHRPMIAPLFTQPIMELALRIPSWMWCSGGRDRAVARHAFVQDIPPEILNRRSRGSLDGFVSTLFTARRTQLFRMLEDGHLARRGILDVSEIRKFERRPGPTTSLEFARLMTLLDIEIWLEAVLSRTQRLRAGVASEA